MSCIHCCEHQVIYDSSTDSCKCEKCGKRWDVKTTVGNFPHWPDGVRGPRYLEEYMNGGDPLKKQKPFSPNIVTC